jgi:hypothetical protein
MQKMLDAHQRETGIKRKRSLDLHPNKRVHISLCHESGGVPTNNLGRHTRGKYFELLRRHQTVLGDTAGTQDCIQIADRLTPTRPRATRG